MDRHNNVASMLPDSLVGSAQLRVTQAFECVGRSDILAVNHHSEIAAAFGIAVAFFGAVGSWAKAHCTRRKKSAEYIARVSSIVHGCLLSVLGFLLLLDRYIKREPYNAATSLQEALVLSISLAYFLVDSISILSGDFFDALFFGHHIVCFAGIAHAIVTGQDGHFTTLVVWCMEITNPFMNAHWLNVFDKRTKGHFYNLNRFGFIVTFSLARGIVGPWLIYTAWNIDLNWGLIGLGCALFFFSARVLIAIFQAEMRGEIWTV